MVLIYTIIVITILFYWLFTKNFNYWKDKNVPFIKPLPLVGNTLNGVLMRVSFGELFNELYQKTTEPILGLFIFTKPCLLVRDPNIIKRILITDFQYFYDRNVLDNKRDDPVSAHVLFIVKNPEWKEIRTKVSPVYSSAKLKIMSTLIEHAGLEMKDYLINETQTRSVMDIKEVSMKFTVNVITSTAFGEDANSFKDKESLFYDTAEKMLNWNDFLISFRFKCYFFAHSIVKLFRMKLFHPGSVKFLENCFWEIMNHRVESKIHRNDLIDILLEIKNDEKHLSDRDILTAQALVFFTAGFETTSSTIAFALHELAIHPEIQTKLRCEVNEVSKNHNGINYNSLQDMVFLDMVLRETLRMYPVLPVVERQCNTRYTIPETGTVIDKHTPIFIPALSLHYDPQYFPEPDVFNPDRFSEHNLDLIQNFTYLPFGEGPRKCIGSRFGKLTAKVGIANIIQNFVLEPNIDTPKKLKFNPNAFPLSALNGVKLKISRIQK